MRNDGSATSFCRYALFIRRSFGKNIDSTILKIELCIAWYYLK